MEKKKRGRPPKKKVPESQPIDVANDTTQNHAEVLQALIDEAKANDKKECGVLLLATGHPYYTHLAANLANSIKYQNPQTHITLLHDMAGVNQLPDERKAAFDTITPIPQEFYNGDPYYVKLCLDLLTPYKRTLYLDVDMICTSANKTVESLLDELNGVEFTIANRGRIANTEMFSQWAKLEDMKVAYDIEGIYDVSSEVVYFEGQPEVFKIARRVYEERVLDIEKFGAGYPDEFFTSIAMEKAMVRPHESPWLPSYWMNHYFMKPKPFNIVQDNFYFYSIGGSRQNDQQRKQYNLLNEHFHYRMGGKPNTLYKINFDKRKVNKERHNK